MFKHLLKNYSIFKMIIFTLVKSQKINKTCDTSVLCFWKLPKIARLWKETTSGMHDPSTCEREHVLFILY